jgi:uncharacterized NAD(P)/FAD-binding protein YdhS
MGRVIIVGGGAAGVWLAALLADRGISEIDIIEPSAHLGRGAAYATNNPDHLLNVTPDKLDPHPVPGYETFVSWLARHQPDLVSGYCPRGVFGAYMDDVVRELRSRAVIRHHRSMTTEISTRSDGLTVTLKDGTSFAADHVVLAIGNLPPRRIAPQLQHRRVIEDPWRLDVETVKGARSVVIAGTGLTAADVAISVNEAAPDAVITLAANRPFMPPADATVVNWTGAGNIPAARPSRVWHYVVRAIRLSDATDHWISVIEATKSHAPRLWEAWSSRDKATFVRHGLRHWLHHRHRMPEPSFALMQKLIATGRLSIARGRVGNVEIAGDEVHLTIGGRPVAADVLINATGPSVNVNDEPLLKAAADRGLISPDAYGLGLAASQSGQALGPDGRPTPGLWILGAWTRGTHFEVVAVPLLRKHAGLIAEAITADLT